MNLRFVMLCRFSAAVLGLGLLLLSCERHATIVLDAIDVCALDAALVRSALKACGNPDGGN